MFKLIRITDLTLLFLLAAALAQLAIVAEL